MQCKIKKTKNNIYIELDNITANNNYLRLLSWIKNTNRKKKNSLIFK